MNGSHWDPADGTFEQDTRYLPYHLVWKLPNVSERPYLVKGMLDTGVLAVLYGAPGAGKSYVALELGFSIARGEAFFGCQTRKGAVIYIACEGATGLIRRAQVARQCRPSNETPSLAIVESQVSLKGIDCVSTDSLIGSIKRLEKETSEECLLVILDTLARSMSGDENSSQDMGQYVAACDEIRRKTNAAVLIVHHSGKDPSNGARGSSALLAAVDTEMLVKGHHRVRTLEVTKQRDMDLMPAMGFELEPIRIDKSDDGNPIEGCKLRVLGAASTLPPALGARQKELLSHLERLQRDQAGTTAWTAEALRRLGRVELKMPKGSAQDAVKKLIERGLLVPATGGFQLASPFGTKGTNRYESA